MSRALVTYPPLTIPTDANAKMDRQRMWPLPSYTVRAQSSSGTWASTSVLELAVFWLLQYVIFKSLNEVPVTDNQVLSFLGIEYKGYMYSYFISAVIGYAAAYVMNRKITFKADANPVLSTILYTIMVVCTIAFNTWFGSFLGTLIKNSGHDSVFIVLLTKLVVMTVPTLWTYPLNRFVIHRKKKA